MTRLSPPARGAERLLRLLARRSSAAPAAGDWAGVVEAASWHGLIPMVQVVVHDAGFLTAMPDDARSQLRLGHALASIRATARRQQLHQALTAIAVAGVPAVVLKGAYLAEHVHRAPELRPMSDIDLLVPPDGIAAAQDALTRVGYAAGADTPASHRHAAPLYRRGGLPIELHHTIEPCAAPFRLSIDDVWARARPCTVGGASVRALAPEDMLLHVATHMAHSHVLGASLVSVLDVAAWTARHGADADWSAIVARARQAGVRRFVYAALALARLALDADVPEDTLRSLRGARDDAVVADARRLLCSAPFLVIGAKAVTDPRDSIIGRLRRVARALLVSPARVPLGQRLPEATGRAAVVATDGYRARWSSLARLVSRPTLGLAAIRQVASVRSVRRWAEDDGRE